MVIKKVVETRRRLSGEKVLVKNIPPPYEQLGEKARAFDELRDMTPSTKVIYKIR